MTYTEQQWQDGNTAAPYGPISAARLAHMEAGIAAAGTGGGGGPSSGQATFSQPGVLATGTGTMRWLCPWATASIQGTVAAVGTAPTGASVICDVKKNGTTIYTTSANRPTIAISANATASTPAPDVTTLIAGDYLTVDISQVGSTIAGADLTVEILLTRLT